ncbi:MAG: aminopeptidase, partial [Lachnospiraceae bacterium oral taxon 082]|nr:aminopeptidase [Lachnospiraceae bacterium oral taxon 082]
MVFDIYSWDKRVIVERINLAMDRISLIRAEEDIKFKDFFAELASFLEKVNDIRQKKESGEFEALSFEELKDMQDELFYDLREDIYAGSVYNPDVLEKLFDKDFVSPLLSLGFEVRAALVSVYEGDLEGFVNILELFLQVYGIAMEGGSAKEIADAIYWYASDYLDVTARKRIIESFTASNRFFYNIIMNDDLSDLRYLFKFGEYIGSNEINTAKYLNSLDNETVRLCAKTFVDGYRDGFFAMQKDISKRSVVSLIYNIGFERIVKEAVIFFEDMGFEVVLQRKPYRLSDISPVKNRGICSGGVNRQFEYDHKFDMNIFTKKAYLDRKLEVCKRTFEEIKEDMSKYGGPARMESFGEREFLPVKKKCANAFGEKQNNLMTNYRNELMLLQDEYIDTSGTAFCIIAWPLPSIAEDEKIYSNIFDDIIRINTLDATKYKDAQQKIIDALDKADTVSIVGGEGNKTSLTIKLHELKDATKETNFENCGADVNIPVGEVFTSPVLKGTEGTLFVKDVFLS